MKKKWIILAGVFLVIGGILYFSRTADKKLTAADFDMTKVERGTIVFQVTASGKINPINTVSVGTQVSGIVERVLVDYNDEVKEGQLLAKIDTSVLLETKNDAKAKLDLAKAKVTLEKMNLSRVQKLYNDKLVAKATLEEAEIALVSVNADLLVAQATYNKALQNFDYATIISPVSGTVISKEVEQGQTVAASLQAPTLFLIAEDLSKMQIEASIAEADIGVIKAGMPVSFTVDAYPNERFIGSVRQIRLSPTEDQNVVMYTVVIEVDNSSRKLLPGMTASVTINIQEAKDVLVLSAMALQYRPSAKVRETMSVQRVGEIRDDQDVVYQFKDGEVKPVIITKGISDMTLVEVISGLKEGEEIIMDAAGPSTRRRRR